MKKLVFAFLALIALGCSAAELPFPTTLQEITAVVEMSGTGTITGEEGEVQIKMLTLQETSTQNILELENKLSINGKEIEAVLESDSFGNRYAVFKTGERGQFTYKIEGTIKNSVKPRNLKDYNLSQEIEEYEKYGKDTKYIESNESAIRTLALNRFDSDSWIETVASVSEWTHNYVSYNPSFFPEVYSAIETLNSKQGTCDEFANLSAGILRAKGIPARVVAGPVFSANEWNLHGWLEAYNPESGWIALDSTYGEAGIVDASHITIGRFDDFSQAGSVFLAPSGVEVQLQQNPVRVNVSEWKQFNSIVSINAENSEIYANSWQDLNVFVLNKVNSIAIIPLEIALPQGFRTDKKAQTIVFGPLEEKEVSWKVLIETGLAKNQYLEGTYAVITFHPGLEKTIRVLPESQESEEKGIRVADIYAIVDGTSLSIEIVLENKGGQEEEVEISLEKGTEQIKKTTETIQGLAQKNINFLVQNFSETEYTVKIEGNGISYTEKISPQEKIEETEENPLPPPETLEKPAEAETELDAYEIGILAVILLSVIAIALLLKGLVFR